MGMLIILTGQSGGGKTEIAKLLEKKLPESRVLSTDEIRKELIKNPEYTKEERLIVYEEILKRAKELYEESKTVILDATFSTENLRERAKSLGPSFLVWCKCSDEAALSRRHDKGLSLENYEQPENADIILDTENFSPDECAEKILGLIKE